MRGRAAARAVPRGLPEAAGVVAWRAVSGAPSRRTRGHCRGNHVARPRRPRRHRYGTRSSWCAAVPVRRSTARFGRGTPPWPTTAPTRRPHIVAASRSPRRMELQPACSARSPSSMLVENSSGARRRNAAASGIKRGRGNAAKSCSHPQHRLRLHFQSLIPLLRSLLASINSFNQPNHHFNSFTSTDPRSITMQLATVLTTVAASLVGLSNAVLGRAPVLP